MATKIRKINTTRPFNFTFQDDLRYRAQREADKKGVSLSSIISISVSEHLERVEREYNQQRQQAA